MGSGEDRSVTRTEGSQAAAGKGPSVPGRGGIQCSLMMVVQFQNLPQN